MKYKSRAITLLYYKYGETSIISKVFTKEKGLQSFIVNGVRSKKSKKKIILFEPFKLVKIDGNFDNKKSLHRLEEINFVEKFEITKNKMLKNFIAMFCAEVTLKVLQENEKNINLFNFVWNSIFELYSRESPNPNFSIIYLLNLSRFLGFYPKTKPFPFFNLERGEFVRQKSLNEICLDKEMSDFLSQILKDENTYIPRKKKSELLKNILKYFKTHHYNLDNITSHLVIESLRL